MIWLLPCRLQVVVFFFSKFRAFKVGDLQISNLRCESFGDFSGSIPSPKKNSHHQQLFRYSINMSTGPGPNFGRSTGSSLQGSYPPTKSEGRFKKGYHRFESLSWQWKILKNSLVQSLFFHNSSFPMGCQKMLPNPLFPQPFWFIIPKKSDCRAISFWPKMELKISGFFRIKSPSAGCDSMFRCFLFGTGNE